MMATADGIAARARAFAANPHPFRRPTGALLIASAALLAACGGGGSTEAAADDGCSTASAVRLAGPGNILSLQLVNASTAPRRLTLTGRVTFDGKAVDTAAGGHSALIVTDGQSPVQVGTVQAAQGGRAQGAADIAVDVVVPAGANVTWHLAHAPLPAPYGWQAMAFGAAEICAR